MIFNRTHLNKYWIFFLEAFVLIHGVAVAIFQGQAFWQMFAFGFMGRLGALNEVIRIPVIDYLFIFIIYGLFLLINWFINLFKRESEITVSEAS